MTKSFAPSLQLFPKDIERLSARLESTGHWSLLKDLWGPVIAKRRTNYNKTRTAQRTVPDKVSARAVVSTL